jgi:signal transduction histidine kinase
VSVRRSTLLVLATATALAVTPTVVYGAHAGIVTWGLLAALGGGALALAHAVAARRARLGSLRRQFAFAVAIAVGQVLVAATSGALLMLVSPHDALFVLIIATLAGVVAARAAQLFATGVMADIEGLRATLEAVGEGARAPAAATRADDELADLAAAANAAIVKLGAAERARSDLIAAVSHDLRTPITSLRLLAEAVDDDIVDEETRRRYLRQMRTHIDAVSALIDDLFELSRLEAGDIAWTMRRVRLDELVGETVDAMRVQAAAKRVRLGADVPAGTAAQGDPEKLQRVLFNLIQNAIRHTPADGSVSVSAEGARADVWRSRSPTPGAASRRPSATASSSRSTAAAPRPHAPAAVRASGWPSRGLSSRRTAGASGWRTRPRARACASRSPLRRSSPGDGAHSRASPTTATVSPPAAGEGGPAAGVPRLGRPRRATIRTGRSLSERSRDRA